MITIQLKPAANSKQPLVHDGNLDSWRSFDRRIRRDSICIEYVDELSNGLWSSSRIAYIDENRVCARFLGIEIDEIKGTAAVTIEPYGPLKAVIEAHLANVENVSELVFLYRGSLSHIVTYDYMGPEAVFRKKREELMEIQRKNREARWLS